jgi:predicted amidophosphoribosyltransferase
VLELLLPQRCLGCGRSGAAVCADCLGSLRRIAPPLCERCGAPTAWPVGRCIECSGRRIAFASARAAVVYDERVRRIVTGWKEHGLRRLAATAADVVARAIPEPPARALTFVPPAHDRLLQRGHHPAERLARELAKRWDVEILPLLARTRSSGPRQRGSTLAERRRNVRGAFRAAPAPRAVCLVDDVYTSGATASAAASALRRAGACEIRVVTFARAVRLR